MTYPFALPAGPLADRPAELLLLLGALALVPFALVTLTSFLELARRARPDGPAAGERDLELVWLLTNGEGELYARYRLI